MQFTLLMVLLAACCVMAETSAPGDHQPSRPSGTPSKEITGSVTTQALPTPTDSLGSVTPAITGQAPTDVLSAFPSTTSTRPGSPDITSWATISTLLTPTDIFRSISRATMPPFETTTATSISKVTATATTTEKIPAPPVTAPAVPVAQHWYNNVWFHVAVTAVLTLILFTGPLILIGMWVQRRRTLRIERGRAEGSNSIPLENIGAAA